MFQFLVGPFTEHVRRCLAESMVMTAGLEMLRQENLVTEEELGNLDRLLASNDNEGIVQWFEMAEERIAVFVSRREGSKLVREIEDFLKEV
jgi:succinate dehydrogenase flavin-adding protein (antitoxin of CptAB toxin-antitoxin module)